MKKSLLLSWYKSYFETAKQQKTDWLSVIPIEARLTQLELVTQAHVAELSDKEYQHHT